MKHIYDGKWHIKAFGIYLIINRSRVTSYQIINDIIMEFPIIHGKIKNNKLTTDMVELDVSLNRNNLYLSSPSLELNYIATKSDLNVILLNPKNASADDIFQLFWHTFKHHYAFFDMYQVDWQNIYNTYKHHFNNNMDKNTVYKTLCEMVEGLNDDHITISMGDSEYSPYVNLPQWWQAETVKSLVSVIDQYYVTDIVYLARRSIRYGQLDTHTGYINIAIMAADSNIDNAVDISNQAFSQAIQALGHKSHLVLDLRFNRGGYDQVAKSLCRYFTNTPIDVYMKETKYGESYTDMEIHSIQPHPSLTYKGKVYLLISNATVSASEVFAHSMNQVKDIMVVGEPTAGFSPMHCHVYFHTE